MNPEAFKQKVLAANPKFANGVASDGTPYAKMDAEDFTRRMVAKNPNGVTKDGHKYSEFLPADAQAPTQTEEPTSKGLLGQLGDRISNIGSIRDKFHNGDINGVSGTLQIAGNLGGAINDTVGAGVGLLNKAARLIPGVGKVEDAVTGAIGSGVSKAANTGVGQAVTKGVTDFSQAHPEISDDIKGAAGAIGGAATLSGLGALKTGISEALGKDVVTSVASDISPELTGKTAAKAIAKGGTTKSFINGTIKPVISDSALKDAEVVASKVPGFTKLATFSDKVNATRDAVYKLADSLKRDVISSGKDRIYPIKELAAKISAAEEPISLKGTAFEKQIAPIKQAAVRIAKEKGGTISSLFDAQKEFDQLVNKTYPNLWDRENAPMRNAIKSVRDTMNKFTDDNLPDGLNFKERRFEQSKLFNAIDNMAPKSVDEIGTNRWQRFGSRHPVSVGLLKKGASLGGKIAATGIGVEGAHKFFGSNE